MEVEEIAGNKKYMHNNDGETSLIKAVWRVDMCGKIILK
jgi:hypothetical protein